MLVSVAFSSNFTNAGAGPIEPIEREMPTARPPSTAVVAQFSQHVHPRYYDRDRDYIPDPARTPEEVKASWTVGVSACDGLSSGGDAAITAYVWRVNGSEIRQGPEGCSYTWQAPKEGSYPVSLTVETADGDSASVTKTATVRDFLIAVVGDSAAAGEGAPNVPVRWNSDYTVQESFAVWEDKRCHRSANAGTARAAKAMEDRDMLTSVTFVNLACSGARIFDPARYGDPDPAPGPDGGLLDPYQGADWTSRLQNSDGSMREPPLPPQLDELQRLVGDRQIDALLISVGINDLNFSRIAKRCLEMGAWNPWGGHCNEESGTLLGSSDNPNSPLGRLKSLYEGLNQGIKDRFPNLPLDRVFISEYPDNTRHASPRDPSASTPCETMLEDAEDEFGVDHPGTHLDASEVWWASYEVIPGLNGEVGKAAASSGPDGHPKWNLVKGIHRAFDFSGYCAPDGDRAFNRWTDSKRDQKDTPFGPVERGTLHPNRRGYQVIGDRFYGEMKGRLPAPPSLSVTGVAPGRSYVMGVTPMVYAGDPEGLASSSVRLDGLAYASGTPISSAGPHVLEVRAKSVTGPEAVLTIPFTVVPPTRVTKLTIAPSSVIGGSPDASTQVKGTVTIEGMAPPEGFDLNLTSRTPSAASVPSTLRVASGSSSASFTITTFPVPADTTVQISATAKLSGSAQTASLIVKAPRLVSVSLNADTVTAGQSVGGVVQLSGLAPPNGVNVALTSSSSIAKVPSSVTVPAGARSATFTVTTASGAGGSVTITATDPLATRLATSFDVEGTTVSTVFEERPSCLRCGE